MKARIYKDKDFKTIKDWWSKCSGPVDFTKCKNVLSDMGIIVSKNNIDVCACWLYVGNTDIAQLGWFISDKDSLDKEKCLRYLIKVCKRQLKLKGYKAVMVYTENTGIERKLRREGFITGDINIKQMIGGL